MVSIKIPKCKIPRPYTRKLSALSESSTRNARFFSVSFISLSRKWRDVTNLPSRPKNGELLMLNIILIVGSSTLITGNASGNSTSQIVSPILNSSKPTIAQISPALTSVAFFLPSASKVYNSFTFIFLMPPSACTNAICCPSLTVPLATLPTAIRPRKDE